MKSTPLVSIIIPCYNHEHYIQQSIQGILDQDYQNIELIIIDDGSKDDSVTKIQQMQQQCQQRFVRFEFRHRPNKGLSATLNEAIQWCKGKYLSIIASDDVMLPHKTSIQVNFLENNPEFSSVTANMDEIDDNGRIIRQIRNKQKEYCFDEIFLCNSLFAPAQMHKLDAIKSLGGYNESIVVEDWYMWLKLAAHGHRIMFLDEVVCLYRYHDHNTSKNSDKMFQAEQQIRDLYKDHPLYPKACYKAKKKQLHYYRDNNQKITYYYLKFCLYLKYLFK